MKAKKIKLEQNLNLVNELITDLLLMANTHEYREIITDSYVSLINKRNITKEYLDRLSNVYLGLMYFLNSIEQLRSVGVLNHIKSLQTNSKVKGNELYN